MRDRTKTGRFGLNRVFFVDRDLIYVVRANRAANLVEAFSFTKSAPVTLLYSDFKRHSKKAVTSADAARILGCSTGALLNYVRTGFLEEPQRFWRFGGEPDPNKVSYAWSEDDLINAQDAMLTIHTGKPRKDGKITPRSSLPSKMEIRAAMADKPTRYLKGKDGVFVPVFE